MDMKVGNRYSFSTVAPSLLGQDYSDMLLMAIGDYTLATMFENVTVTLNNIVPYLGENAPEDATKDVYYVFKTPTGSTKVFGASWINPASIEVAQSQVITVTIDSISSADVTRIRNLLATAGYNILTTRIQERA